MPITFVGRDKAELSQSVHTKMGSAERREIMFTGIIEEVGMVTGIHRKANSASIEIRAERVVSDVKTGDSIAVNGICLTVTSHTAHSFTADMMHETMRRSAMKYIRNGSPVNLERAMMAGDRFGGHIVSGHIDGTGIIKKIQKDEIATWYTIGAEERLLRYIIEKGSIAIDGISLTVASVQPDSFCVSVIPHTAANTTLPGKKTGDVVNLENDCIGKYVEHFLHTGGTENTAGSKASQSGGENPIGTLSREFLYQNGF